MIDECDYYNIAIYLRLSKEDDIDDDKDKKDESLSISNQRRILNDYIDKKFENKVKVYEYVDDGFTGMNNIRPGLNQMLQNIQMKKINCVIVKDCSRLARKNSLISYYVDELFYENNIRFISLFENFDNTIDTDTEKLILPGFFNEYHVKTTSKKVRATKYSYAKKGLHCGGYAPYGYIKDPDDKHKLLIDNYAADVVRKIFNDFACGIGLKNICYDLTNRGILIPSEYKGMNRGLKSAQYGKWTTKTVSDMLHNPTYAGHLTQHKSKVKNISSKHKIKLKPSEWVVAYNSCPVIINQELFDKVQQIWNKNRRRTKKTHEHLLTGFCYCKECGHTIGITLSKWIKVDGEKCERYICNCNYYKKMSKYKACTPHKIVYDDLERYVLNDIKILCQKFLKTEKLSEVLKNNDKTNKIKKEIENLIYTNEVNIKNINEKKDKLYEDKLSGFITTEKYLSFIKKFDNEIEILQKDLEKLNSNLKHIMSKINDSDSKYAKAIKDFLKFKSITRDILFELIEKIEIDENLNIEIYYKMQPLLDNDFNK